jgi:hypothetical protein
MSEEISKLTDVEQSRTEVFSFSFYFLATDYALRWVVLEIWRYRIVNDWVFWTSQFVIGLCMFIYIGFRQERIRAKYQVPKTEVEDTAWSILFLLFIAFSSSYIAYSLYSDWRLWVKLLFSLAILLVYSTYTLMLYVGSIQRISKADRARELDALSGDEQNEIDANDIRIVRMETEIASVSHRVESYTLESALFGALAFSGFLTLISSSNPVLKNSQDLLASLSIIFNRLREGSFSGLSNSLNLMATSDYLMAAITIETLVCSMFFVSVIVSRLRFYGVLKQVDYAVRTARMYNDKEEEVYNLMLENEAKKEVLEGRLQHLTQRIADAINKAEPLFRDLDFIANAMWALRNSGIGTFVLILLTSAFLISNILALIFVVVSLAAYIFTVFHKWMSHRKLRDEPFFQALERRIFRVPLRDRTTRK